MDNFAGLLKYAIFTMKNIKIMKYISCGLPQSISAKKHLEFSSGNHVTNFSNALFSYLATIHEPQKGFLI